ncbi:hypothetical protein HPB47_021088, partial [Ixodes persulcatus]
SHRWTQEARPDVVARSLICHPFLHRFDRRIVLAAASAPHSPPSKARAFGVVVLLNTSPDDLIHASIQRSTLERKVLILLSTAVLLPPSSTKPAPSPSPLARSPSFQPDH